MELIINKNIYITKTNKNEIAMIDFDSCAEPTSTLEQYYNQKTTKPDILINGGLFTFAEGKPVMDFINEKITKSNEDWIQYGIGILNNTDIQYGKDNEKQWRDFISAYPPLVVNSIKPHITIAKEIAGRTKRTILGYDNNYIYTISINGSGVTLEEAADIALTTGCTYAINLDGGGSTRLLYQGKAYATSIFNRPVDNIIAIYTKKEKTIYRVQLGAFSIKENAINLVNELKQKGYNAFIVQETK